MHVYGANWSKVYLYNNLVLIIPESVKLKLYLNFCFSISQISGVDFEIIYQYESLIELYGFFFLQIITVS